MSKVYAAAIVFKSDAGDEADVTEELIDALTASRLPIDIRFIGGAVQVPDTDDEYASEEVGQFIAGQKVHIGKVHPAVLAATRQSPAPEAGDMSTSDGLGGDPRRDEDNQAALDTLQVPKIDDMARRATLKAMRFAWLRSEGWDVMAMDYERGEITLTELLRRLNDEPRVVEHVATWLEEDAAESVPEVI